ncbi:MAG: polysaccharide deacetylase [Lachnospiraceae bacterium]|nr:polysaccharide deacetylase [Lachnospiraceae bacterium]
MENANYEEVLRRRQERRRLERKRRKRKVMMMYVLMLSVVLIAGVSAFAFWKNRLNHEHDPEKVFSDTQLGTDEPQDAVTAVNPVPETSVEDLENQSHSDEQNPDSQDDTNSANQQNHPDNQEVSGNIFQRFIIWIRGLFGQENAASSNSSDKENADSVDFTKADAASPSSETDSLENPSETLPEGGEETQAIQVPDMNTPEGRLANLLFLAERLALGYDYDKAIELLQTSEEFSASPEVLQAIETYEIAKASLVEYDIKKITHVFFHSLVMDNARAFDGDDDSKGYNQVMTTSNEFLKILEEMYSRGYVLVRLHDMAHEETDENGNVRMVKGKIMLPEGKKAFVMSQDDVCYYPYMSDDGFAKRIIVGEDGKPTCVMEQEDGTEITGSFDLIPLLEDFIQLHPDFSYRGARAVIAFTGYEGILGYRTAASYQEKNPNYEADRQQAALVAQCLRDNGWELASHSWGHRYLGQIEYDKFVTDTDKWEAEVESLIGPTDIILFPFGDDIGDWHGYASDNDRFNYLYSVGFRYFCNVDSKDYWVQLGDTYLRQGRRNLDGFRMWKDIEAGQEGRTEDRKLDDLFRAEDIFDPARPTPVEWE